MESPRDFEGLLRNMQRQLRSLSRHRHPDYALASPSDTGPPTGGTWAQGDTVRNIAPAPGGFIGWVCVEPGTPGTWKGYGLIEA